MVLEKTLESPLDYKEIKPVNPKGNQSWIFIGRTDAEASAPILWPPDVMSRLIRKDPDSGKDWGQEEKGTTEDEMVGWHHWLHGHEFDQALGVGDGWGSLVCYSPRGCKESYTTERLKWTEPEIASWLCYSAGLTKSPLRGPALTTWSKIRLSYLISLSQYMLLVSSVVPFTMCSCVVCLLSVSSHRN